MGTYSTHKSAHCHLERLCVCPLSLSLSAAAPSGDAELEDPEAAAGDASEEPPPPPPPQITSEEIIKAIKSIFDISITRPLTQSGFPEFIRRSSRLISMSGSKQIILIVSRMAVEWHECSNQLSYRPKSFER